MIILIRKLCKLHHIEALAGPKSVITIVNEVKICFRISGLKRHKSSRLFKLLFEFVLKVQPIRLNNF